MHKKAHQVCKATQAVVDVEELKIDAPVNHSDDTDCASSMATKNSQYSVMLTTVASD